MAFTGDFRRPIRSECAPRGVTLVEILVVLVILSLLLLLSLPGYRQHVLVAQRRLAQAYLLQLHMRQQQFIQAHRQPATSLAQLGVPAGRTAIDGRGVPIAGDSPGSVYLVELRSHERGYILLAVPQHRQRHDTRCGTLSLDRLGVKGSGGPGLPGECW